MKRIGIFGGTFNPPHIGHSIIADDVREQMHLDKILFIPSGVHPLKEASPDMASAKQRYEMAKLAFGNDKNFEVSDIEIKNTSEKSYTVDTLIKLKELYKKDFVNLYLILSTDNLIEFPKWKNPEKLFLLSEVICVNRPGYYINEVKSEYSQRVKYLNVLNLEISSTIIREHIRFKKSIKYLVHPEVENYIYKNKIYQNV
ncbi:MAG TPA: nicotinate (nicotinamide) nucleotide adenylyltransferase [Bacteroidetes bacterium]|nr:nicotinate (nicotinamide) nucleotide adenylyltransferase [Bacteroidota bacterium]HCN37539.1 nicotinate (nicotinamide) nucleotide adenylyltransferase [Bacteroidota bacterium]